MKVETYNQKDAMKDFVKILDRLEKKERNNFLQGLHIIFFDPLGRRILTYLAKEDKND